MISEHWFWSDKSASGSPVAQARGQEMAVSRQAVYAGRETCHRCAISRAKRIPE